MNTFLLIPVTLWLLLPPGICVCRGFGNLLPFLATETVVADIGSECEDTEHAPWCPVHKMTYLTDNGGLPLENSWDAGLVDVLPASLPIVCPTGDALCLANPPANPADSPLYLNLCALRI